jgi:pyrroloquinoline quinone biosynthesis protein B
VRIEILGSAAGGGFPQWNCSCHNCKALRAGIFQGKPRTQTQVAISENERSWLLLNASPDLRLQIEASQFLHPCSESRSSPIAAVLVTSADIDQIAGLLSLREMQPFRLYSTPSIRRILQEDNSVFGTLNRAPRQVTWTEAGLDERITVHGADGADLRLSCSMFSLGTRYPGYVSSQRVATLRAEEAVLGTVVDSGNGKRVAYMPAVPAIDENLLKRLEDVDLLLFDGTFWSDDELIQVQGSGASARQMGHVPLSGAEGSLRRLAGLRRPRKILIHVNNTNPILNETGPEYAEVRAAGWEVAEDGWSLNL